VKVFLSTYFFPFYVFPAVDDTAMNNIDVGCCRVTSKALWEETRIIARKPNNNSKSNDFVVSSISKITSTVHSISTKLNPFGSTNFHPLKENIKEFLKLLLSLIKLSTI
jgi:hypothetical protein